MLGASLLLATLASGCAAGYQPYATTTIATPQVQAQAQMIEPAPQVVVSEPDLVTITPDVQVVAAYDEPVFFTGGFYWRESAGGWYRSRAHDRGWTASGEVPYAVRSIENRGTYRNYRPAGAGPRYTRHDRAYEPRPSRSAWNEPRPTTYQQPHPAYQPRPSQGYQPRPTTTGYGNPSPAYQPRPSQGYQPRPTAYQPRPSQSYGEPRPSSGYSPRPTSSKRSPSRRR